MALPGLRLVRAPTSSGCRKTEAKVGPWRGAQEVETQGDDVHVVLLADADLGESAGRLFPLVEAVRRGETDVAIASFASRGGFGVAKRIASRGILLLTGKRFQSPLSGQRALSRRALSLFASLPSGWGVEVAMTGAGPPKRPPRHGGAAFPLASGDEKGSGRLCPPGQAMLPDCFHAGVAGVDQAPPRSGLASDGGGQAL